uniref:Uncharacterized protein n=1 Tax=Rhizophora mucronata TaxID=61149 RepID=A0A2P2P5G9_RHIMU
MAWRILAILRSKRPRHNSNIRQHSIPSRSPRPWIWSSLEQGFEDRIDRLCLGSQLEVELHMHLVQLMVGVEDMQL